MIGSTEEMTATPSAIRGGLGRAVFGMVAGPDGPDNRARIHGTPGPRWFAEDRPIRRVLPDFGALDLAPLIVLVVLYILMNIIIPRLYVVPAYGTL